MLKDYAYYGLCVLDQILAKNPVHFPGRNHARNLEFYSWNFSAPLDFPGENPARITANYC